MYERYTEKARRVVFFGRYEASQVGSPHIETEHLLLGLLREDKALTKRFLCSAASVESIRKQIEEHTTLREKISTRIDIPLSNECKRVLAYAAEEAERLSHTLRPRTQEVANISHAKLRLGRRRLGRRRKSPSLG